MNKKSVSQVADRNLCFIVVAIFTTLTFMMEIISALYLVKSGLGTLNNVSYNLFQLKIVVREGGSNKVYNVFNYPLIPIVAGIIYNTYIIIKNRKGEKQE